MKRKIITFAIIILCFLMQSTIFNRLSFAAVKPNLLIIATSSFGFMRGKKEGLFVGAVCGFMMDIFWSSSMGFYTLIFSVIGYANGFFRRLFYDEDIKLPIALIAASETAYGLAAYIFLYMLRGDFDFGSHLIQIILPELVYTILVTLVLYQVILHINKRLETEEQRSASRFV